ncbi:MAG: type II toxin-antitoxin system HigB family toxin [Bacteroidales bacterium]|nr:type II toxin-antitoxin system HigB family toxin [Bacteroidales bacterium]
MHIISKSKLQEYYEQHADAMEPLLRWYDIAMHAEWSELNDIKKDFPSVDYVGNQRYVFNIKGNTYRLIVVIKFTPGLIFVRFVGTHAEYDKIKDCSMI